VAEPPVPSALSCHRSTSCSLSQLLAWTTLRGRGMCWVCADPIPVPAAAHGHRDVPGSLRVPFLQPHLLLNPGPKCTTAAVPLESRCMSCCGRLGGRHTARCLLPVPCCPFHAARSLLPVPCCPFPAACSLLPAPCCPLPAARSLLPIPCCPFPAARSLLPVPCCLLPPSHPAPGPPRWPPCRALWRSWKLSLLVSRELPTFQKLFSFWLGKKTNISEISWIT